MITLIKTIESNFLKELLILTEKAFSRQKNAIKMGYTSFKSGLRHNQCRVYLYN